MGYRERVPREECGSSGRIRGSWPEAEGAARRMRRELTPAEGRLWQALRARRLDGLKFRRQQPLGPFVLDFFCPSCSLVVELDGSAHDTQEQQLRDAGRAHQLATFGLQVIRFRNEEVMGDLPSVLARIRLAAGTKSTSPPTGHDSSDDPSNSQSPPLPKLGEGVGG